MDIFKNIISYSVIILTIMAFLMQFIKTYKTNDASSISHISQSIVAYGGITWLTYSIAVKGIEAGIVNFTLLPMVIYVYYISLRDHGFTSSKIKMRITLVSFFAIVVMITYILRFLVINDNDAFEIIGLIGIFIGGTCTGLAFLPQTIKSIVSKDVKSLSIWMTITYLIAQILWVIIFTLNYIDATTDIRKITEIWGIITAVIPTFIQASILFAIIKWK